MTFRDTIPRTECGCGQCQVGCRSMPGMLAVGDLEKIVGHISNETSEPYLLVDWKQYFVASEGAKVGQFVEGGVRVYDIKTITPAQRPNGECVFYKDGRCGIHPVSPLGCACVDSHMTRAEGDAVVHPALGEILGDQQADGPYSRAWIALEAAGRVARPRAERRAAFERLYAQEAARSAPRGPGTGLEA